MRRESSISRKMDRSAWWDVDRPFFWGITPSNEKLLLYDVMLHVNVNVAYDVAIGVAMTNFRSGRWRYTHFVLTNQNQLHVEIKW